MSISRAGQAAAFLTLSEVEALTGFKRAKEQRDWLQKNGFRFVANRFGKPILSRNCIHERLGGSTVNSLGALPDLQALKELTDGSKTKGR